jgi:hypothetical protein
MDKTVVKLLVELISTLALVTRKLKQRQSRESHLADVRTYFLAQDDAVKWVKNFFAVKDIKAARQRLDQLMQEEVATTAAQILEAVHGDTKVRDSE